MDGATIQARVYAGYAKAAAVIGVNYSQYRPLSAASPLGNFISVLKAALDSSSTYSFKEPNEYGDPTWFALINDANTQTGDYLVGAGGNYFIAGKQFLLPVIVVECNRKIKITRQNNQTGIGAIGYSGIQPSTENDILGGVGVANWWPASILLGGKSQRETGKGSEVDQLGWKVLLPPSVPVQILPNDIITDDMGRRYTITGAELTDLGWRIVAQESHA